MKYLFTLVYLREQEDKRIEIMEHIVAETWPEALAYWGIEFQDQAIHIQSVTCNVPVIALPPLPVRGFPTVPKPL